MFTPRCTRSLLKRLKVRPEPAPPAPSTKLGDWYCNVLYTRPQQVLLCASEKTLLPVLLFAKGTESVAVRLTAAVGEMLRAIGIPETVVETELAAMAKVTISTTASRTVLGSMNDFAFMLETHLAHGDWPVLARPQPPLGTTSLPRAEDQAQRGFISCRISRRWGC